MEKTIVFFDTEIGVSDKKIYDIGAVRSGRGALHTASVLKFCDFAEGAEFLCGHNIIHHDLNYILRVLNVMMMQKHQVVGQSGLFPAMNIFMWKWKMKLRFQMY